MTFNPSAKPEARQKAVAQLITELNADDRQILCGPWRSEVGFEVSYWIPFLSHLAKHVQHFDQRAAVVTRGGLAPLYSQIAAQGFDLYALRSVTEVRRENLHDATVRHQGKTIKQLQPTEWDDAVLADAADALGLGVLYHVVHPAWMYWALSPFWEDDRGLQYLTSLTAYRPLPRPVLPEMPSLPEKFVAVKCYSRPTFPYPDRAVVKWVEKTVANVASQCPVVVLGTESIHDDHTDIPITGPNILSLPANLAPEQNLLVQAAVLGQATAMVGTYGGVAQLALRMGVPSVSVWLQFGATAHAHLALSNWLSVASHVPFITSSIADSYLLKQVYATPKAVPVGGQKAAA